MTVSSINARSTQMLQSLVSLRSQLDDLNRQISTGKKSDTYAGLGVQRGVSITLRSQLAAIESYDASGQTASTRINLAQTALTSMAKVVSDTKAAMFQATNVSGVGGASQVQSSAKFSLDELTGLLNTQVGGRYIFAGKQTDKPAVESSSNILNGDGARAGLVQIINERKQADLGSDGLGRLDVTNPTLSSLNIAEEAVSPFGFKLASVTSNLTNVVVNGPTGSPATLDVNLGSGNPNDGESLTVRLTLPDGTSTSVTLKATTASPAGPGQFTIGTLPSDTTANLTTALTAALKKAGGTELTAASAVQASNEFFNADANHPPVRVDGPPFDSATATKLGSSADTVIWYTGDAGSDPARQTATALVDPTLSVGYGVRANEQGLRSVVQNVATLAAVSISSTDPNGVDLSQALNTRLTAGLNGKPGDQKLSDVTTDLANAQISINSAKSRHTQQNTTLQEFLTQIEGVSDTEVGAQILALQTRLQASMQVTAMTYQTSLVNYLK
ncbi:flagellar biosynthesis protein FlgL [Undibacter mobilis]|uniref:Flagellar biosynthesis protein FlgL n=1 Tax=Undibacter mobilis TaxID=2292256 RepID=A0A371BCV9_9BRAD|nr:flagellar biosynthesis protein FlgL [Undibacter mobilis]RDV05181.1 flagellar biosynthesis protein FlgL [Undibacter mobilis]